MRNGQWWWEIAGEKATCFWVRRGTSQRKFWKEDWLEQGRLGLESEKTAHFGNKRKLASLKMSSSSSSSSKPPGGSHVRPGEQRGVQNFTSTIVYLTNTYSALNCLIIVFGAGDSAMNQQKQNPLFSWNLRSLGSSKAAGYPGSSSNEWGCFWN